MPQPPTTPALSLNNINISIAGKEICHDINLTINPGECHILIGPNGSGKSTLLCAIMGIKPFTITSGTILLNGVDITTYGITDRARAGLGLAFQRPIGLEGVSVRRLAHALVVTGEHGDRLREPRQDRILTALRRQEQVDGAQLLTEPLLVLTVFQNKVFTAGVLSAGFAMFALSGTELLTTQRFQLGEGFTPLAAGLVTAAGAIAAIPTSVLGGIVLGTGDLSELALGWCTFGVGDQMAHYGVNAGIPKTLIQHLIRWVVAERIFSDDVGRVLLAILGTEISPELVPADDGEPIQSTQAKIGPYALQDFTLWHVLRRGARPSRIAFLAYQAWSDATAGDWPEGLPQAERVAYDLPEIRHWLELFHRRFFTNQFKRSTLPNGPKVVAGGSLSPRGDWRMPSDAGAGRWVVEDWVVAAEVSASPVLAGNEDDGWRFVPFEEFPKLVLTAPARKFWTEFTKSQRTLF